MLGDDPTLAFEIDKDRLAHAPGAVAGPIENRAAGFGGPLAGGGDVIDVDLGDARRLGELAASPAEQEDEAVALDLDVTDPSTGERRSDHRPEAEYGRDPAGRRYGVVVEDAGYDDRVATCRVVHRVILARVLRAGTDAQQAGVYGTSPRSSGVRSRVNVSARRTVKPSRS